MKIILCFSLFLLPMSFSLGSSSNIYVYNYVLNIMPILHHLYYMPKYSLKKPVFDKTFIKDGEIGYLFESYQTHIIIKKAF